MGVVLFVCLGNLCRSAMAERLFRSRVAGIEARSAGLRAVVGHPMARTCQQALAELGVSGAGHAATQFNDQVASPAELILTAEERQRDAVTRLVPGAIRRTFALKEFVRLGHQMPAGRDFEPLPERVARVAELRGKVPAAAPGADDIADPYGRPLSAARECAAEISKAVDELAALLG